jgi:hypothetical protein
VDHRHVTKVGIVGIVEPVLSDESLKIVDVRLPAIRELSSVSARTMKNAVLRDVIYTSEVKEEVYATLDVVSSLS